jgi:hypothetical protein
MCGPYAPSRACEESRWQARRPASWRATLFEQTYKDVTFETLNKPDFLSLIKVAFPAVDWERAYEEYRAAGEKKA